jgi:hypothetical protein
MFYNSKFEKVIFDWAILNPDQYFPVISLLACAIHCQRQRKCITFVILSDKAVDCQISKKKGSCMEKEEAITSSGSRMYEKKVFVVYLAKVQTSTIRVVFTSVMFTHLKP